MRSFVFLLVVIVNGVLSAPSPIDELESKSSISAQRSSNSDGVLQVVDHVQVPEEEREFALNSVVPEVKAATSKVKVVPKSIWARFKAIPQRWIAKLKFDWAALYLFRVRQEQAMLMGYTPGYMAYILTKADPDLTITKKLAASGELKESKLYKQFVSFNNDYKEAMKADDRFALVNQRVEEKKMKLSWFSRFRAEVALNKARRLIRKGLSAKELLALNISPYLYLKYLVKRSGDISKVPDKEFQEWKYYRSLYEEKFPIPELLVG
ncbi:hypothetical protein Plhal304r1_c080g0165841 [Plasmopara halstedii]